MDYRVRGTAKCKVCKKLINRNDLRIGKLVPFKSKHIKQFYHVDCAFKSFEKAKTPTASISDPSELDGLMLIDSKDKVRINDLLRNVPYPKLSSAALIKNTGIKVASTQPRHRTQLVPITLPAVNVMFTNANQLTPLKLTELKTRIQKDKPLIIAVYEIKPKNSEKLRSLLDYKIPGYTIHPVNLVSKIGRRMAIYTHYSIEESVIEIKPEIKFEEVCLLEIKLRGGDTMLFGSFYRSPTRTDTSEENNTNLNKLLMNLSGKSYSHKCFVGDLNFKDINWESWTTFHKRESKETKFIEAVRDGFLFQHNHQNSRIRGNDTPSLKDLIFTDEAMQVSDVKHQSPLGKSDHNLIIFKFHCYLDYTNPKDRYAYGKGDFDAMRNELSNTNWQEEYVTSASNKNIAELWGTLQSTLKQLRDKFVPIAKLSANSSWKKLEGFPIDKNLQDAVRRKHATHRHWTCEKNVVMQTSPV